MNLGIPRAKIEAMITHLAHYAGLALRGLGRAGAQRGLARRRGGA